ncbi:hypothetical protein COU56_02710 [Candidatus Pacearchaeota archaeon CG10_big_fil_rev_8_21_14_0_10_31_9]|nr:MAG: hypothetical protein COU56_02710 [Candidatus Pacearchaeota archaeon CG10_big_fil_rev_8_21_14_0_10_31_9]
MKDYYSKNKVKQVNLGNFESNIIFLRKTRILSKNKRILEIGSGKGSLIHHLKKEGYNITGTEIDYNLVKEGKKLFGNIPLKTMSGDKLNFKDSSFDVVLSFDVFEHISDSDKHLKEVRRVLKKRGYYLLGTPNKWTNIPWEIIQSKSFKYREYHCSLHNYWQIKKRFNKNGFEVKFVEIPILNDFTIGKVNKVLGRTGVFLFKLFNPDKMPYFLKTNFYLVAKSRKLK